jgi:hypothetical protein
MMEKCSAAKELKDARQWPINIACGKWWRSCFHAFINTFSINTIQVKEIAQGQVEVRAVQQYQEGEVAAEEESLHFIGSRSRTQRV